MTPSEYESLTAKIAEDIRVSSEAIGSLTVGFGSANKICGASGYKHQIDVSLLDDTRIFIIECKRWDKHVGVQDVLVLASRAQDLRNMHPEKSVKTILASTKGVSKNAAKVAKHFDIEIEIIKSAADFTLRIGLYLQVSVMTTVSITTTPSIVVERNGMIID